MQTIRCIILKAHRKCSLLSVYNLTAGQARLLAVSLQALKHKTFPGNEFWEASRVLNELSCFPRHSLLIAELHFAAVTADQRSCLFVQEIKASQSLIGCFHFLPSDSEDLDWSKLHVVFLVRFTFRLVFLLFVHLFIELSMFVLFN